MQRRSRIRLAECGLRGSVRVGHVDEQVEHARDDPRLGRARVPIAVPLEKIEAERKHLHTIIPCDRTR